MPINEFETVISAAGMVSECLLVVVWIVRGRKWPFWTIGLYGVYHLSVSLCLRVLHLRRHDLGDGLYYIDDAIDFALLTGIIVELFVYNVGPLAKWPLKTKSCLSVGLAVGTLIPIVFVFFLKFAGFKRIELWDDRLDILTSALLCTYVLISGLSALYLRAQKNAEVEAIRLGLAGWTGFGLAIDFCHMMMGWTISPIFDEVSDTFWVVMILLWALAVWNSGGRVRLIDKAVVATL